MATETQSKQIMIPHNYYPRTYELEPLRALDEGYKRAVMVWHRRAGKDKTCLNYMIKSMFPSGSLGRIGTYYYFFPTFAQGRKILWDGMDGSGFRFMDHFPKEFVKGRPNEHEMRVELINGSSFQIVGTDRLDGIVGTNPVGCVFTEYALQNPLGWKLVRPIMAENRGWALFNFTPRGKNHAYDLFQMAKKSAEWFVTHKTVDQTFRDAKYLDGSAIDGEDGTPVITQADIERERSEGMEEELIQQEYYCSFEGFQQGSYYGKILAWLEKEGRISKVPWEPSLPVDTFWDLGMNDSTSIWFGQTFRGEPRFIDFFQASGEGIAFYANHLRTKPYSYGRHYAPHDIQVRELGTGKSRFESAHSFGIRFVTVVKLPDVNDGINATRELLYKSWFDSEKCREGLNALAEYHKEWDPVRKSYRDHPHHNWASNPSDALRTAAVGISRGTLDERPQKIVVESEFDVFSSV